MSVGCSAVALHVHGMRQFATHAFQSSSHLLHEFPLLSTTGRQIPQCRSQQLPSTQSQAVERFTLPVTTSH